MWMLSKMTKENSIVANGRVDRASQRQQEGHENHIYPNTKRWGLITPSLLEKEKLLSPLPVPSLPCSPSPMPWGEEGWWATHDGA